MLFRLIGPLAIPALYCPNILVCFSPAFIQLFFKGIYIYSAVQCSAVQPVINYGTVFFHFISNSLLLSMFLLAIFFVWGEIKVDVVSHTKLLLLLPPPHNSSVKILKFPNISSLAALSSISDVSNLLHLSSSSALFSFISFPARHKQPHESFASYCN